MDEELLKRNTDCVYFLASPLTCKKGIECEYRHSQIARLNPRECWYWLSGSCLNPTCAFRHPPLDVQTGEKSEAAQSSIPVNKPSIPCYYFFNGYCNKGDRCSFLHDSDPDAQPSGKLVKTSSPTSEAIHLEINTLAGMDTGSALTNGHLNSIATTKVEVDTKAQHKEEIRMPVLKDVPSQSSSSQISASEGEEAATIRSDSLPPEAAFVDSTAYPCEHYGSEEPVDDELRQEERWESSPGFDVLVDGELENLGSEDDQDYLLALDRERRELNDDFSGYDFENPDGYNSNYPDTEFHYESEMYYRYDSRVNEDDFRDARNIPVRARVEMFDSKLIEERNHKALDLRDELRRRRFVDGHSIPGLSRAYESSQLIHRSYERPWRHGMVHRKRHKRLASEVGRFTVDSLGKNGIRRNGGRPHSFPRHPQKYQARKQFKEQRSTKRQRLSSEVSRRTIPKKERRSFEDSSRTFSGPKTLTQIREEKRRSTEEESRHYSRPVSTDFDGPKPLSEILKDKRKLNRETETQF